ncbi:MAG: tetratricopeptide repeat protein, partial [Alphaproteobacteria bacterium]
MATITEAFDLALDHQRSGRLAEAEAIYHRILGAVPDHPSALHLLGLIAHQRGQGEMALGLIGRAIARQPDYPEAHNDLGLVLQTAGRTGEAVGHYRLAIAARPDDAAALFNLGTALATLKRPEEAVDAFRRVVALRPRDADAWFSLGVALREQALLEEAATAFYAAIAADPGQARFHNDLGNVLHALGQAEAAADCYRLALILAPDHAEAHSNLGNALQTLNRPEEALAAYRAALRLRPDFAEAHNNLGTVLDRLGEVDQAIAAYRRSIALDPDCAEVHGSLALALLLTGEFADGWEEYEWRWRLAEARPRTFDEPRWRGEPLGDRTLLVWAEQGLGDTLQFARYLPLIEGRAHHIVFEVQRPLVRLLRSWFGDRVVTAGDDLPPFDVQIPLLSLPRLLGTDLATIPGPLAGLGADPQAVRAWKTRLGESRPGETRALRVGLAWAGNPGNIRDRRRSLPFAHLERLLDIPGVAFYSFQFGERAGDPEALRPGAVADFAGDIADFAEEAAALACMDLVVTVDTVVAHLAGSLGVPVWIMLPFVPDWRWLKGRDDSPWYPTARLIRQPARGDWDAVVAQVDADLRRLVASNGASNTLLPLPPLQGGEGLGEGGAKLPRWYRVG